MFDMALQRRNSFAVLAVLLIAVSVVVAISLEYQSELWFQVLGTDIAAIFHRPLFTIGTIAVSPSFLFKSLIFLAR
jgi:hypothetical protein